MPGAKAAQGRFAPFMILASTGCMHVLQTTNASSTKAAPAHLVDGEHFAGGQLHVGADGQAAGPDPLQMKGTHVGPTREPLQ